MAYVRRTKTLVEDVRNKIKEMRGRERKVVTDTELEIDTPLHREVRTAIEAALWAEAYDIKDKVPDSWCSTNDRLSFRFERADGTWNNERYIHFKETDQIKCPPNHRYYETVRVEHKHITDGVKQWLQDNDFNAEARRLIDKKYDDIADKIAAFIEKHASLNSALKEMPELEFYIPQPYLDKVEEETQKADKSTKTSTVEELSIDVNELTSIAVAHRIASATE